MLSLITRITIIVLSVLFVTSFSHSRYRSIRTVVGRRSSGSVSPRVPAGVVSHPISTISSREGLVVGTSTSLYDIPLIPAIVGAGALVFAVFNIENKVDLTDQGRADAARKRRAERLARGEAPKSEEGLDPYRYKWFEENDDDIDLISGKKSGGGCG
jgi:hypothetical protein